jgi:hypothetical protein
MSTNGRKQVEALSTQIEEMWGHQDTLFAEVSAGDRWGQKHGPDWTFADVPYHLAYCNTDLIVRPIQMGKELPAAERESFAPMEKLDAWNARKFAERPAGQTIEQTMDQLQASRQAVRQVLSGMSDADLERSIWWPFMASWQPAISALMFCVNHDWSEFMQLRIHMGKSQPVPSPAITNSYLGVMIGMGFPMFLDKQAADGQEFTSVFAFTDPGVTPLTIRVADGAASVRPGQPDDADLVLAQSAETWEKTFRRIVDFSDAIQSGAIQVSDGEALATFGKLFPM